jgi:GNAT superfamily N-acetyltransferase
MKEEREEAALRLETIDAAAVAAGLVVRLGTDRDERRHWRACDLASIVEGCFRVILDPATLDAEAEKPWLERIRGSFRLPSLDEDREPFDPEHRYWLLEDGRRAGTLFLSASAHRGPWLRVASLYVLPASRGRGTAGRALEALSRLAATHELRGIRLTTHWTWQEAVRFYLARDFWVVSWKHDLGLVHEPALPKRLFRCEGERATLEIGSRLLCSATRDGDRLLLGDVPARDDELHDLAEPTFALLLALHGWPLVRSEAHWAKRYHSSDIGNVEGLAHKIGVFEEVARDQGWVVDTLSIPGLSEWQAWARGEDFGENKQRSHDLDVVLDARRWKLDEAQRTALRDVDPYYAFEQLLRKAVTAATFDDWWADLEKYVRKPR